MYLRSQIWIMNYKQAWIKHELLYTVLYWSILFCILISLNKNKKQIPFWNYVAEGTRQWKTKNENIEKTKLENHYSGRLHSVGNMRPKHKWLKTYLKTSEYKWIFHKITRLWQWHYGKKTFHASHSPKKQKGTCLTKPLPPNAVFQNSDSQAYFFVINIFHRLVLSTM